MGQGDDWRGRQASRGTDRGTDKYRRQRSRGGLHTEKSGQQPGRGGQAAPGQPHPEPFPGPSQPHADRAHRAAQATGGLLVAQPLEIAKHERNAIPFRKPGKLFVQDHVLLARDQRQVGQAGPWVRAGFDKFPAERFVLPPAIVSHPRLPRARKGHTVEPVPQQFGLADRACLPRKDQERRLECVLGGVPVANDLHADAQDHRPMPHYKGCKCELGRLIATRAEPRQELAIRRFRNRPPSSCRHRWFQDCFGMFSRHDLGLPGTSRLSAILLGRRDRFLSFFSLPDFQYAGQAFILTLNPYQAESLTYVRS